MSSLVSDAPSHFHQISLTQILRADREIFSLLASEHKGPIRATAGGKPPVDDTFEKLMHDPRVVVHLIAMPRQVSKRGNDKDVDEEVEKNKKKKLKKSHQVSTAPQLPEELKGLKTKTSAGKPLCWHYNMSKGCNNPVKKERCRFGMHHCMKCLKTNHGASKCRSE